MKHNAGQDHWYGPLVQVEQKVGEALAGAEQKVEKVIARDVEQTIRDLSRVEKKFERFGKSATLGAWAADIEESIGIAEKTLESFSQTLDRMADKSSKEGLFGTLSGNAAAFEATKAQYVRGLQESINEIKRKIREAEQQDDFKLKAELEIRLGNLEGSLQEASERIDPILEGWGDSLGDYIANGIVYGFDQGESPAKAFANFLKRELYTAIASALSKQFTLSLSNIFGGGGSGGADFLTSAFNAVFSRSGSGSGAAAAGASPAGAGSSGGLGGFNPMSLLGGNSIGMGFSNAATWLSQASMFAGTGAGNYLTGFAGNAAGMSNLALGGAGLLGGLGANLLFDGKGYSSTGGSLGATAGMVAGGPIGAAIGGVLGGDGAEGTHAADVFALPQDVGTNDLAGARREEVVRHVPDDRVREEPHGAHGGDGAHQNGPADAPHGDAREQDRSRRNQPPVVGLLQGVRELTGMRRAEEQADEDGADRDASPESE